MRDFVLSPPPMNHRHHVNGLPSRQFLQLAPDRQLAAPQPVGLRSQAKVLLLQSREFSRDLARRFRLSAYRHDLPPWFTAASNERLLPSKMRRRPLRGNRAGEVFVAPGS